MVMGAALIIMVMTEMAVVGEAVVVGITTKAVAHRLLGTLGLATKSAIKPGTLLLTVTFGWTTRTKEDTLLLSLCPWQQHTIRLLIKPCTQILVQQIILLMI